MGVEVRKHAEVRTDGWQRSDAAAPGKRLLPVTRQGRRRRRVPYDDQVCARGTCIENGSVKSRACRGGQTLQSEYGHLIGQSVYQHGEAIDGSYCDTWAFTSGYWTFIQTEFQLVVLVHSIVAGAGTTEDAALANAIKNLGLRN